MARAQPNSGITRSATEGPLQDITCRYNPTRSPGNRRPTLNGRRKPDPLRTTPGPIVSTSLPPSSPPSASSRPLVAHAQNVSPVVPSDNFESESDGRRIDATAASDATPDADPFGFFALENKLKVFRNRQQHAKPRYQPAPSPQIQAVYSDFVNSPTPLKRRNESKNIESPVSFGKDHPEPDSTPSSPPNAISKKGKEKAIAEENSPPRVGLAMNVLETPAPNQKAILRPLNTKSVSDVPSRRISLRQTDTTAKSRKNIVRTREEGRRGSSAEHLPMKTTRQRSRIERTANTTSNRDINAKERQARLDYFKKLEDYQLEKENVYVI